MPKLTITMCDICHAVKGETNHWYVLSGQDRALLLEPLSSADPVGPTTRYLCSRTCVIQALAAWTNRSAQEEKQPLRRGRGAPRPDDAPGTTSPGASPPFPSLN